MSQDRIVIVASVSIFVNDKVLILKENKPSAIDKWKISKWTYRVW